MTLNIDDLISFTAKVLHIILKNEISLDKAFQRVKHTWKDRESYKVYYDVISSIVKEYYKLEYVSTRIFNSKSCKNIVKAWILLYGLDYFKNKSQIMSFIKRLLKRTKFRDSEELGREIEKEIEDFKNYDIVLYLSLKYSFPEEFVKKILELFNRNLEEVEKLLYWLNNSPTWIRINTLKIDIDKCIKLLEQQGLEVDVDKEIPFLVRVVNARRPVHHVEAIKEGYAVIQDKASVLTVLALNPEPGDVILDLCAAPGMKTSLIAQLTECKARIIAVDISYQRVLNMMYIFNKLGISSDRVDIMIADSRILKLRRVQINKILVDAPCTSSGAVSKDPAVKIALRQLKRLSWYTDIQCSLVNNALEIADKDTLIVYATCSLLPEEGEEIVSKFRSFLEFVRPALNLSSGYCQYPDVAPHVCRTFPHIHHCEGFFISCFYKA